jgi:hypothetical protein
MDYGNGIAAESRTLVVVPTMLGSAESIEALVEALEVRFLANRDAQLRYGLLTDFHDAAAEHLEGDDALVDFAAARIAALNEKYARAADGGAFFLFHRPRRWNARERVWMGYERKRGKLGDLNALLRGSADVGERFSRIVGDVDTLGDVRYVITLDSDTQLPRESAATIVATMAHPLNRPRFGSGLASASACRAPTARATRGCTAASRGSIRTRAPSPTSTRTCSARDRSSARGSTTSTRSSARCTTACPRTASSATTCSKAATRARGW